MDRSLTWHQLRMRLTLTHRLEAPHRLELTLRLTHRLQVELTMSLTHRLEMAHKVTVGMIATWWRCHRLARLLARSAMFDSRGEPT